MRIFICLKFLIIASVFTFFGCKNKNNEVNSSSSIDSTDSIDISSNFESDIENKPKFFLKYWDGMSYEDYIKVSHILAKEGVLEAYSNTYDSPENHFYYLIGNERLETAPIYSKEDTDKIVGIEIIAIQKLYPELVTKNSLTSCYLERNPEYAPISSYLENGQPVAAKIDYSEQIRPNVTINLDVNQVDFKEHFFTTKLPKNEIIIEKENSIIVLSSDQNYNENNYATRYKYNLDDSNKDWIFWGSNESKTNSKNRVVCVQILENPITAKFFDKNYYSKIQNDENKILQKNKVETEEMNKKDNLRKNSIKDEI
jgi:hypothetical protein